ncbi:MAG: glycosyltransferase family 9 protein [Candidatus Aminicenantaceae bacterium]
MIKADCLYFRGDKPCKFKILCDGCRHYKPFPKKILIIKCRAQGDVLRTTALLHGVKRKYSESHISWLVDAESVELLENNPFIDKLLPYQLESVMPLLVEEFDVLISLDKEAPSTSVASLVKCSKKFGFGMNTLGNLIPFNKEAEYAYQLGIDDDLKFKQNTKTYQEIVAKTAEIEYKRDPYVFQIGEHHKNRARDFFKNHRIPEDTLTIGLNTGAGVKFQTKQWPAVNYVKLIDSLSESFEANIFLLGGKRETELNRFIEKSSKHRVYNTGNDNSLLEFAGFLSLMDIVVTSDTLGMHLAIAQEKKVVALFGPTCPQEIDLYGRGVKLYAGADCSPCYKQTCDDMKCMEEITPEQVFKEIQKLV